MIRALELLGAYTAGQWGMVTTRQAQMLGVDEVTLHRLKTAGLLEGVRHGVHALTSAEASDTRAEQAAWLALRPGVAGWERPKLDPDGGVISHRSAARQHGLGDLVHTRVEMTVPRRRTMRDPNVWLHRAELTDADVTVLNGLPVTTPTRLIRDLLDQHIDASHIATIIRQAVEGGQVRLDELAEQLKPYARRYGAKPLSGTALLELLLAQIGLSTQELAVRPSPPITWGGLQELTWEDLQDTGVTWGQLAKISPEIARGLKRATTAPDSTTEPNDET
jgi:predicted transcriptional regulator of viral defense system